MFIDESVEQISDSLDTNLEEMFDEDLTPIWKELGLHDKRLEKHDKILRAHAKFLRSLKNDQLVMLDLLDREQILIKRRLSEAERKS
jgi:hypothetical protein